VEDVFPSVEAFFRQLLQSWELDSLRPGDEPLREPGLSQGKS